MRYKKINVEVVVAADEAEEVIAALNLSLDRLGETYAIFGGEIETVAFEHRVAQRKSALAHTLAAGESVAVALRAARDSVTGALRSVI